MVSRKGLALVSLAAFAYGVLLFTWWMLNGPPEDPTAIHNGIIHRIDALDGRVSSLTDTTKTLEKDLKSTAHNFSRTRKAVLEMIDFLRNETIAPSLQSRLPPSQQALVQVSTVDIAPSQPKRKLVLSRTKPAEDLRSTATTNTIDEHSSAITKGKNDTVGSKLRSNGISDTDDVQPPATTRSPLTVTDELRSTATVGTADAPLPPTIRGKAGIIPDELRSAITLSSNDNTPPPATTRGSKAVPDELRSTADIPNFPSTDSSPKNFKGNAPILVVGSIKHKLTLVLTARGPQSRGDYLRVSDLVKSLVKFFDHEMVYEFIVIHPDGDGVHPDLEEMPWPLRKLTDSQILGRQTSEFRSLTPRLELSENGGRGTNYRAQMILKLGVAKFISTALYLVLDCDVFATRRTTFNDLVAHGKGIFMDARYPYSRHNPSWWKAADGLLQAKGCVTSHDGTKVIGVTPALLATDLSLATIGRILELHGRSEQNFAEVLFRLLDRFDWTEYTLYWTQACIMPGAIKKYHIATSLKLYEEGGFEWQSWRNWKPKRAFNDPTFVFSVIQSISGVDPEWVSKTIAPYLEGTF